MSRDWELSEEAANHVRAFGFRRCYREPHSFHGVGNVNCDCLRTELPLECQAKTSGRLAHPGNLQQLASEWLAEHAAERAGKSDRAIRSKLSAARAAGRIGRRG